MTDQTPLITDELPGQIGGNQPPEPISLLNADDLLVYLNERYAPLLAESTSLLADIRATAPENVQTDADNGIIAAHMTSLRGTIKAADNHREHEKAEYLRAERTAQQFFAGIIDRLSKARDILQKRGDAYTARKVAEERAERIRIATAKAAEEQRIANEKRRAEAEAAELAAAAERARKPENIAKLETASENKIGQAAVLAVDQMIAASEAENATVSALASSADIARTRHESGHLSTAQQVPYVEITDADALDMKALWPFIKEDEKLKALKAWAKTTSHKKQMAGAIVEFRDKAAYR